jgi:hypothetical protein
MKIPAAVKANHMKSNVLDASHVLQRLLPRAIKAAPLLLLLGTNDSEPKYDPQVGTL